MREILFRGKRENNGEWKYGSYVYQYGCHEILLESCEGEYGFDHYSVKPETVGQFTGLFDKNGKKVFEGDILPIPNWQHGFTPCLPGENESNSAGEIARCATESKTRIASAASPGG